MSFYDYQMGILSVPASCQIRNSDLGSRQASNCIYFVLHIELYHLQDQLWLDVSLWPLKEVVRYLGLKGGQLPSD